MVTDPIFYRLFEKSPETLFLVLGMTLGEAKRMAARYQYLAIEFKETAHRADGVFQPRQPGLPIYFLEVQFYPLPSVYADILAKAYTYLKQNDPWQPFVAVVLFASRALEPACLAPYQPLLAEGIIRRIYLDELSESAEAPLGLSILRLIVEDEKEAGRRACGLVERAKSEIGDVALRADLLELIETVILCKLPRLGRQEIQAMLKVSNIRETRVYQEALEEGREVGREEGIEKGIEKGAQQEQLRTIRRLASRGMKAAEIAELLALEPAQVRKALRKKTP